MAARRRRVKSFDSVGTTVTQKRIGGTETCTVLPKAPTDLWRWLSDNRLSALRWTQDFGAVRFRGFHAKADGFSRIHTYLGTFPHAYSDGHTPRTKLSDSVFTSTEYDPAQEIHLHSEMSYASHWPDLVMFFCAQAPERDGETPIADNRDILQRLSDQTRFAFQERGVLYSRSFTPGVGLSWQRAFGVKTPEALETSLAELEVEHSWRGGVLNVRSRRPATTVHQASGKEVWFNQSVSFHSSILPMSVRSALSRMSENDYPNQAYFGDGGVIPDATIQEIRNVFEITESAQRWEQSDLLLIDNVRYSHGRRPYVGARSILAALGNYPAAKS